MNFHYYEYESREFKPLDLSFTPDPTPYNGALFKRYNLHKAQLQQTEFFFFFDRPTIETMIFAKKIKIEISVLFFSSYRPTPEKVPREDPRS